MNLSSCEIAVVLLRGDGAPGHGHAFLILGYCNLTIWKIRSVGACVGRVVWVRAAHSWYSIWKLQTTMEKSVWCATWTDGKIRQVEGDLVGTLIEQGLVYLAGCFAPRVRGVCVCVARSSASAFSAAGHSRAHA